MYLPLLHPRHYFQLHLFDPIQNEKTEKTNHVKYA